MKKIILHTAFVGLLYLSFFDFAIAQIHDPFQIIFDECTKVAEEGTSRLNKNIKDQKFSQIHNKCMAKKGFFPESEWGQIDLDYGY